MNPKRSLARIITSKTRLKLLRLFFSRPKESFYVREAVSLTGEEINSVRRELENLKQAGILEDERRGNRLFYSLDPYHPLYENFLELFAKIEGLGGEIIKNRSRLGELKLVLFSGHFVYWDDNQAEVDFLVVGKVVLPELGKLVIAEEKRRGREINYAVMDVEEFRLRKRNQDPFLLNIILNNPVVILGNKREIRKI